MGIGFAIPVSTAKMVMEQIIRSGAVTRGWIGVEAAGDHPGDRRVLQAARRARRDHRRRAARRSRRQGGRKARRRAHRDQRRAGRRIRRPCSTWWRPCSRARRAKMKLRRQRSRSRSAVTSGAARNRRRGNSVDDAPDLATPIPGGSMKRMIALARRRDARGRDRPGLRPGEGNQDRAHLRQDRAARGLRQAEQHRLHDGPRVPHRRQDGAARPQDRGHREGRPVQARHRQGRARRGLSATTRSTSRSAPVGSGVALAMLPVAEEYKKILIVEPAVADSITGDKWNRYIFRTGAQLDAGRGGGRRDADGRRQHRHARAGLRLRPRRRQGRSRMRSPRSAPRRRSCTRSTRRSRPPTSPRRRSASSTR